MRVTVGASTKHSPIFMAIRMFSGADVRESRHLSVSDVV